jgi:hypothetical protein
LMANTSSLPMTKVLSCGLACVDDAPAFCAAGAVLGVRAVALLPDPACAQSPLEIRRHAEATISRVQQNLLPVVLVFVIVMAAP